MFKIRKFVMTFYLVVNYVLLIQPCVIELITGAVHPKHHLPAELYNDALMFIASFNMVLGLSFATSLRYLPCSRTLNRYRESNRIDRTNRPVLFSVAALMLIALGAKWVLHSVGGYRMLGEVQSSPFLQLIKVIALFDLFLLIFIGEFKATRHDRQMQLAALYFTVAGLTVGLAFLSGSRSQVATVVLIAMISHRSWIRRHFVMVASALLPAIPSVFVLFPFLAYYRNSGYDLGAALDGLQQNWENSYSNMLDVLTTRLNYLEPISHAIYYTNTDDPAGGSVYWNNFLGLIPRLLWPGKPEITNGSQELGHMLQLVAANDYSTSIGLRPIGEAYFELAWLGLIVAVVQGLAFAFLHKQFGNRSGAVFGTVYIYAIFYVVSRDGFFAILPGLVYLAIGFVFFFGLMTLMLPSRSLSAQHNGIQGAV
jgi:hypothetical protein